MKKIILFFLAFLIAGPALYAQVPTSPILIEPPKEANVFTLTPTLSWDAIPGVDCYFIYITADTNLSAPPPNCVTTNAFFEIPSNQLVFGVTYYWYVQAHNSDGWSDPSPYFSFTTTAPTINMLLDNLENSVHNIVQIGELNNNQGNILISRLETARHQAELGNRIAALVSMYLFKLRVFILNASGLLTQNDANTLNEEADGVIDLIQDLHKPIDITLKIPKEFKLMQNYPNPFNPSTTIEYSIPENSVVTLKVYDVVGKEVAVLIDKYQTQGSYIVNWNASKLSSGIYIYRLSAGNYTDSKKMVLSK
jgi:hypothetical protein